MNLQDIVVLPAWLFPPEPLFPPPNTYNLDQYWPRLIQMRLAINKFLKCTESCGLWEQCDSNAPFGMCHYIHLVNQGAWDRKWDARVRQFVPSLVFI